MNKNFTSFFIFLFLIVISTQLFAAGGRLAGTVSDAITGDPLSGANVFLEGTSIGTATDLDGGYFITNIPPGTYQVSIIYIGYDGIMFNVEIEENQSVVRDVEMNAVAITGEEIVVTAQAEGQNAAINKQLASENIVNVVSSARIQELPDANAAESIGRLPGVSLVREGGQATKVVIRGLSPEYNRITINGVPIPSNEGGPSNAVYDGGGRGTDMRMVSSNMLDEIKISKTNTADMDAAVIGGTVDLGMRKAGKYVPSESSIWSFMPAAASLKAQGGYTDLTNEFNNYKFDLILERRFLDERLGVLFQGIIQQQNLTSNRLNANYYQIEPENNPDRLGMNNLDLFFYPRTEKKYNGTLTFDYDLPAGNLALTNIFSQSRTNTNRFCQDYDVGLNGGRSIHYYLYDSPNRLNLITNILNYDQKSNLVNINATLSHSYSENISPDYWEIGFEQLSTTTDAINEELPPKTIAERAHQRVDFEDLELRNLTTTNSFTKQRELRGALDLTRDFNIADFLSLELKAGGMYSYTDRFYDYNRGYGVVWFGELGERIVEKYPWLADEYGIDAQTNARFWLTPFLDPDRKIGTYLDNNYTFDNKLDLDLLDGVKEVIVDYGLHLDSAPTGGAGAWVPQMFNCRYRDYSGDEDLSAGYLMGTFNIGQMFTLIAGARYQNLTTSYRAYRFYNASVPNPYPRAFEGIDTTVTKSHGYWLPNFHFKFDPLPWLSLRGAYSNTIAYPNFRAIVPIIDVYTGYVDWNNVNLKPFRSKNFDLQLSVYNNTLGLFTFGGFLKHIDDFTFWQDHVYITNPDDHEGLHDVPQYPDLNVLAYEYGTWYNNPYQVEVWGIETDWQTHFWYLPGALKGLVLNVNYTHVFSEATYPQTWTEMGGWPDFEIIYIDTTYKDRLINQPDDIVNVSLGYDYKSFSVLLSMIYQSGIFSSTSFYNANRQDKDEYLRLDLVAKQKLPWYNTEIFLNLNNLNGANDTYIRRGNGFIQSEYSYGLTAELGLRINLY